MFTLFGMLVLSVIGLAMVGRTANAVRLAHLQRDSAAAFNLAESGAERGLLWLHQQGSPPQNTSTFGVYSENLGAGSYTVNIVPDADNASNPTKLPRYLIVSAGTVGMRTETVQLYVQLKSFGSWAYFNNIEDPSLWYIAGMQMNGPVHSNNADGALMNVDWVNSTTPIFMDTTSVVAGSMNYYPAAPVGDSQYRDIYAQGIAGLELNTFNIPLPATSDRQKNAAWGSTMGFPTSTGVYVPTTGSTTSGGLYLKGDSTIQFATSNDHAAWQIINITNGGHNYTVTVKRDSNQTVVQGPSGGPTTYSGTMNGVIYVDGNVTSLSGTLADNVVSGGAVSHRNAYTLATNVTGGDDVTLTDNLVYKTQPDKSKPWNDSSNLKAATMGIVTQNFHLDGGVAPTELTVNAIIMAGGLNTQGTEDTLNWWSAAPGNYYCLGGLIEYTAGVTGMFDPSSNTMLAGYLEHYTYDYRLLTNPPPYFPTTNGYQKLSWQRSYAGASGS